MLWQLRQQRRSTGLVTSTFPSAQNAHACPAALPPTLQVSAPLYRILTMKVGGEFRFASAAAKRLASMGALLRGDRNAIGAGSELKGFDIDNAHGEKALVRVLMDVCGANGSKPMPGVKVCLGG
jgi:hypothetical protein